MIVIGLTGSMGMGKSTVSDMMRRFFYLPVWDADASVRRLLRDDRDVREQVGEVFPEAILSSGALNRTIVREIAFQNLEKLEALELLLHPLLRQQRIHFYKQCRQKKQAVCVVDIPLLFENQVDSECDRTIVVSAPSFVQKQRILSRPGMTPEMMVQIEKRQLPDTVKKQLATYVLFTGLGRRQTFCDIKRVLEDLKL